MNNLNLNKASKIRPYLMISVLLLTAFSSCKKYLDIIPDNIPTIDNAFTLRNEAEKYLYTCYSFLPKEGDPTYNIGYMAGDEVWIPYDQREFGPNAWQIARGSQNAADPYSNAWSSRRGGGGPQDLYGLFTGIRNCNIFLANVKDPTKVLDLRQDERERWIAEVQFLKAYYHFYLLRMYGPIPLVKSNIDISAAENDVRVKRAPFDEGVTYITSLLDSAATTLPLIIGDRGSELGRITKPIALAVKAKVLLMAASPLFNGNSDYIGFKDQDGINLFNTSYDANKWKLASDAAKAAIESATAAGFKLYEFPVSAFKLSDTTKRQMSIRNAFTERWNAEHVWANPNSLAAEGLQRNAMARISTNIGVGTARQQLSVPIKIAEQFYTVNGVPINEDKTLNFNNKYSLRTAIRRERFHVKQGYTTARLNFDREPRFYADLGFDGGVWYKYDSPTSSDSATYVLEGKSVQLAGANNYGWYNETGYFIKKVVDWNMASTSSNISYRAYPWPQVRLADLYLMYAEALNETLTAPDGEVFDYINRVRKRAGLLDVQKAWTDYSSNPTKFGNQAGMREIIQQERLIELAFEGSRYWDILRWKKATEMFNQNITGWSVSQGTEQEYYKVRTIYPQSFIAPRDYLWPIRTYDITVNPKLTQNPGW
ncbi:Starch-binding associating with outer membrane [Pedobacter steynii]|uniref:Starch-binding associating with outer membrane n=1 Tax=Pedobacter steynii TaxID=430522 RepID=A0A1G9V3B3_9SPHI|nr:RagB/SusD family nutrient uptake outer membrane protein [Pedobacter steynii]SDM66628.1 Starch-binding associating with outer membrane [Pedobacter steynii]